MNGTSMQSAGGARTLSNVAAGDPIPQPIPSAVRHLDVSIENLHQTVSFLEERLQSILGAQPPKSVEDGKALARHSLALQIESGACSVDGATSRLQALISRLEL